MLALTTSTGRSYALELKPIPPVIPMPQEEHRAYVVALTHGEHTKAPVLGFTILAADDSMGRCLVAWQRMSATHYAVVAESHTEAEAQALAAELGQNYGIPVRG